MDLFNMAIELNYQRANIQKKSENLDLNSPKKLFSEPNQLKRLAFKTLNLLAKRAKRLVITSDSGRRPC
jgi:hypothetical protein